MVDGGRRFGGCSSDNGGSFAFGNATIGGTHNYSAGSFSISSGKTLTESGTLNWSGGAIAGPGTLAIGQAATDRKTVGQGKSVDLGGRRNIQKKKDTLL